MNRQRLIYLVGLHVVSLCLTACLPGDRVAGNGPDSGNAFTLSGVVTSEDKPVPGAEVTLYPANFVPGTEIVTDSMRSVTDSQGRYLLKASQSGSYNIQAVGPDTQTTALISDIQLQEDKIQYDVPDAGLLTPGTLILYPEDINFEAGSRMYIPGTGVFVNVDTSHTEPGILPLRDVPQSGYRAVHYLPRADTGSINVLPEEVTVESHGATTLGGNVDSILTGTWFSTDPKGWSFDSAYIAGGGIKVPGLQVYGGLSFTARNNLMTDWEGRVAVEYLLENDTLYTEMIVGFPADGQVDKAAADGFVKISEDVPERYQKSMYRP